MNLHCYQMTNVPMHTLLHVPRSVVVTVDVLAMAVVSVLRGGLVMIVHSLWLRGMCCLPMCSVTRHVTRPLHHTACHALLGLVMINIQSK